MLTLLGLFGVATLYLPCQTQLVLRPLFEWWMYRMVWNMAEIGLGALSLSLANLPYRGPGQGPRTDWLNPSLTTT